MSHCAIAALQKILLPHVELSKSRLETLCLIVIGMISARTVNLTHVASERPGTTRIASTYRRLQRFFQYVALGRDWAVPLIVQLLGLQGSWYLALDRTQWRVGTRDVNFLVLAVITRRHRVSLMWIALAKRGNSATDERVALLRRYLKLFDASTIRLLLADREFIGREWMEFLSKTTSPSPSGCEGTSASPPRKATSSRCAPCCACAGGPATSAPGSGSRTAARRRTGRS